MIGNLRQYRVTQELLNSYNKAIADYDADQAIMDGLHPRVANVYLDLLKFHRDYLFIELTDYRSRMNNAHFF